MGVTRQTVVRWAWASLVANCVIILTGGLVRLTGSGLGCDTWPRCNGDAWTAHEAIGYHSYIEFGNRTLTFVLTAVVVGTLVAVWKWLERPRGALALAWVLVLGIPLQAVVGGISVLVDLNPWVVGLHMVLSMALVVAATALLVLVRGEAGNPVSEVDRILVRAAFAILLAVLYLGTIVTGSGPYAGNADAPRNGLRPDVTSMIHAGAVALLVAVTVVLVWRLRGTGSAAAVRWLLLAELAQGAIGYAQYVTDEPRGLVAIHLIGSAIVLAAATHLVLTVVKAPARVSAVPVG